MLDVDSQAGAWQYRGVNPKETMMSASPSRSARLDMRVRLLPRQRRARLAKNGDVALPLSGQDEPATVPLARGPARPHGPGEREQEDSRPAFPLPAVAQP